jgi:hypothetical protein
LGDRYFVFVVAVGEDDTFISHSKQAFQDSDAV